MVYCGRAFVLAMGLILTGSGSAFAQQIGGLAIVPADKSAPVIDQLSDKPAPADRLTADTHVESTELGFDKGIAPAPGRKVSFKGKQYRVADVAAKGGGPTFAGGSQFVIGVSGSVLIVGLASELPEKQVAGQVAGRAVGRISTN